MGRYLKVNPDAFFLQKKALILKIGVKFTLGFVVGVRHVVPAHCFLSGNLTNLGHGIIPFGAAKVEKIQASARLFIIFFEIVWAMPAIALAAVPPPQMVDFGENDKTLRSDVVFVGTKTPRLSGWA
jgi:hypothetical protein